MSATQLPTYLNAAYIKQALEKAFAVKVSEIIDFHVQPAITEGENFCSTIYRAHVRYKIQNLTEINLEKLCDSNTVSEKVYEVSLIVKDMLMSIADIGSSEFVMYDTVLPQLEHILELAKIGQTKSKLRANCLLSERGVREVYVLEDLNAVGYRTGDRCQGLDEAHSLILFGKLAQFHAASMLYIKQFPHAAAALPAAHFAKGAADPIAQAIAYDSTAYAITMVGKWPDFEEIACKMRKNMQKFDERVMALVDPKNSNWPVINHGDLWMNNTLFSYDASGAPKDVVFVDFQNCFVGSPGYDINYLLNTSLQLHVLQSKRYELLRHYYATLKSTLSSCGAQHIPSWQQIMLEVRNCEFIGYYAAVCELPLVSMSKATAAGFNAATFADKAIMAEKHKELYANTRVQKTLRYVLDRFNELGVLD